MKKIDYVGYFVDLARGKASVLTDENHKEIDKAYADDVEDVLNDVEELWDNLKRELNAKSIEYSNCVSFIYSLKATIEIKKDIERQEERESD